MTQLPARLRQSTLMHNIEISHQGLFHGLNLSRSAGTSAAKLPSKQIALSSIVRNAAGFCSGNRISSRPGPAGDSYQQLPACSRNHRTIAPTPPGWLLLEL